MQSQIWRIKNNQRTLKKLGGLKAVILCFSLTLCLTTSASNETDAHESNEGVKNPLISHGTASKSTFSPHENLKLLIWNIGKKNDSLFLNTLKALLKDSHISMLQEVLLKENVAHFYENSNLSWWTAVGFYHKESPTGVSSSSIFPTQNQRLLISDPKEPFTKTPKMTLFFDLPIANSDQSIQFVNVHGINFVGTKKFQKHMEQIFKETESHNGPLVLAGDFNTWSEKRAQILNQLAQSYLLNKVTFENDPRADNPLDHVFVRGFEVKKAQVLNEIEESDHKPLFAELRLLTQ